MRWWGWSLVVGLTVAHPSARKEKPAERRIWGIGASAMVEFFPKFGEQQSVFTGARLHVGVHRPIYLILHVGYTAAEEKPGNGDDGVMVGGGVEAAFGLGDTFLEIVARDEVDGVVTQTSDLSAGTLTSIAALAGGGVRGLPDHRARRRGRPRASLELRRGHHRSDRLRVLSASGFAGPSRPPRCRARAASSARRSTGLVR